jgi:hypothetical protein
MQISCDGVSGWVITTANVATKITDADFPTPHKPCPIFFDGYVFILGEDGSLYNSDIQDPTSWDALNFITPEMYPDKALWLTRQANQLCVVSSSSVEFFYDAANADGSPLNRTPQAVIQIGSPYQYSIASSDGLIMMLANSPNGGLYVVGIESLKMNPVSNIVTNRAISEYIISLNLPAGTVSSGIYGNLLRVDGHFFYVLYIWGKQFVYDIVERVWVEFLISPSTNTLPVYTTMKQGETIFSFDQFLCRFDSTYYYDGPEFRQIPVTIQTNLIDGGNLNRKFCRKMYLVGDNYTSTNTVTVSWTDNDFQSFHGNRTIDLVDRPIMTQCGAFRRRGFKIEHSENNALRLEFIELELEGGTH